MTPNVMDNKRVVTVMNGPAWHRLGTYSDKPMTAMEGHAAMGGSFTLYKKPVGVILNEHEQVWDDEGNDITAPDNFIKVPGHYAIVRGPTSSDDHFIVFDYVTEDYHVVQVEDLLQKFDEKVGKSISSLGLLQDGKKMFLSWMLNTIEVVVGDEVQLYGNLLFGFDSLFSSRLNVGTFRVVCENTWMSCLYEASEFDKNKANKNKKGTIYSGKHTNPHLLNDLGEWMGFLNKNAEKETALVENLFKKFAETPIKHEKQAEDLIAVAWPDPEPVPVDYPEALREKAESKVISETKRVAKMRELVYNTFTTDKGIMIGPNYWGLFNSGTQVLNKDNLRGESAYSITYGERNSEMNHWANVLRSDIEKE